MFHVDNITFLLLYRLQRPPHQKFSFHLSPYSWFPFFILPSPGASSPLVTNTLYSVSMYVFVWFGVCVCVCVFCFLVFWYSTYEWNHMVFVFSIWLFLLSIIHSRSIHFIINGKISSFFFLWLSGIPLCIDTISSLLIRSLMDTLFPYLGYCE